MWESIMLNAKKKKCSLSDNCGGSLGSKMSCKTDLPLHLVHFCEARPYLGCLQQAHQPSQAANTLLQEKTVVHF